MELSNIIQELTLFLEENHFINKCKNVYFKEVNDIYLKIIFREHRFGDALFVDFEVYYRFDKGKKFSCKLPMHLGGSLQHELGKAFFTFNDIDLKKIKIFCQKDLFLYFESISRLEYLDKNYPTNHDFDRLSISELSQISFWEQYLLKREELSHSISQTPSLLKHK
jgi:hypothetical protein